MVLKTKTEAAITDVSKAIGRIRGTEAPTTFDDSRVGDSNSNAKVERSIREVKGLIRHQVHNPAVDREACTVHIDSLQSLERWPDSVAEYQGQENGCADDTLW